MTAQVHAGPSALHSFPSSSFSSAATSPAATPSSEREFVFDNLAGLSASSRFDIKGKTTATATATASATASSSSSPLPSPAPTRSPPTSLAVLSPASAGPSSPPLSASSGARPPLLKRGDSAQRQSKHERSTDGGHQQQSTTKTHRPRLKSLQSLNAGPASPSLSEHHSGNAHLLTSPSAFSRSGQSTGGGAIERLQPLASAGASASASSAQRSETAAKAAAAKSSGSKPAAEGGPLASSGASLSPRSAAAPWSMRNENEYTEFGSLASGSATRSSLETDRATTAAAARARTQSAHALAGPGLKRSNTVSVGFESLSSMDAGASSSSTNRQGNSSTFGFASASAAAGRSRHGPGLGARRQTVSNIHANNDFDHLLSSQGRTMAYSRQPQQHGHHASTSSVLTSPQSHHQVRERPALQGNQLEAKVVILGTQGVGKTSLVHRYTSGQFSASSIPSTIGASFLTKKLIVDGVKVRLQLWDTAGQERFRSMAPMYYRGSNAAVIVYDITSMQSFLDVKSWIEELRRNMASDLVIHIVGAKLDLAYSKRDVALDFARATVRSWVKPASPTPPDSPDLSQSLSPSKATSRLGGLGNLAIGSASRLASFPRGGQQQSPSGAGGHSHGHGAVAKPGSAGSSAGSAGSDLGQDAFSDGGPFSGGADSSGFPTWEQIEVSEVSAKDDEGIEDVFLAVTKKLVERKAVIEQERLARERNSIILSESSWDHAGGGPNERGAGAPGEANWSCCT
ncbi:uncharacterized protein PFL1_04885 [Pseudozyma flocculosa PF-1]|uniref:Uncharacterized protein n=1 Tax=Pseudozyma flocculosa PF-1 TaxID=1277687 RepID=A0A061H521_9BASI|nr:uncharacterized protein PFL1_04885 [Pseudozyma flocculosa PF-1]EPQ27748.1 hypothetical protein PFL1_04885 [Pseudozyma flocculosa PF-1]